ncbi:hypothetical protein [Mangrovihabitans endophyticus]|uniref:Uncharacterized protein n=1 Tax=Mangrovihabitans endophyticus TaxID=1751298 RepID=A0A8J3BZI1_9ACTN|nr:hypothetical protein [Mangrovihabitans endophyticus]GGK84712.1 hypothetical protein GCM10012284_18810 [Mangrovihabitans endophyticus]
MSDDNTRPGDSGGTEDELVAQSEELQSRSAAAKLFDVRLVIGGLFVLYGVLVTLLGIFDNSAEIDKAQGVRINLWMGLAMLVLGGLFLLWRWWRPVEVPSAGQARSEEPDSEH